jgi:hypothetical protein
MIYDELTGKLGSLWSYAGGALVSCLEAFVKSRFGMDTGFGDGEVG